jgi:hypothetical protein
MADILAVLYGAVLQVDLSRPDRARQGSASGQQRPRTGHRLCRAPLVENASGSLIGGPGLCQEELGDRPALLLMLLASGDEVIE